MEESEQDLAFEYIERLDNMNTTIYEAVDKYKKDDELPYTEYSSLGYFGGDYKGENYMNDTQTSDTLEYSGYSYETQLDHLYSYGKQVF